MKHKSKKYKKIKKIIIDYISFCLKYFKVNFYVSILFIAYELALIYKYNFLTYMDIRNFELPLRITL